MTSEKTKNVDASHATRNLNDKRPSGLGLFYSAMPLTYSADDFGLSLEINQAVEIAHTRGALTQASLMVAGPAAQDAIARAKRLPALKLGLHLVVIEGPAILPPAQIPDLVDARGQFPGGQLRLGINYYCHPAIRRQLRAEIAAQFAAFADSGLQLHHADAHKHMHLHPIVGRMMLEIGQRHGLNRIRIPAEPPAIMRRLGEPPGLGARALYYFTKTLRAAARRHGIATNDHVFGLAWSGHFTADRLARLLPLIPPGDSELYFHPATAKNALLTRLMPDYEHTAELAALLSRPPDRPAAQAPLPPRPGQQAEK